MKPFERILYFFVLPILAVLLYPPQPLDSAVLGVIVVAVLYSSAWGICSCAGVLWPSPSASSCRG